MPHPSWVAGTGWAWGWTRSLRDGGIAATLENRLRT